MAHEIESITTTEQSWWSGSTVTEYWQLTIKWPKGHPENNAPIVANLHTDAQCIEVLRKYVGYCEAKMQLKRLVIDSPSKW